MTTKLHHQYGISVAEYTKNTKLSTNEVFGFDYDLF